MIVLSTSQIRKADSFTIEHEPISSLDLMERAATKCYEEILRIAEPNLKSVLLCCGPGNNGGDGLAIARQLHLKGFLVTVVLLGEKFSSDNLSNQKRCRDLKIPIITTAEWKKKNHKAEIIIDAIFGTGLTRTPEGEFADCIHFVNSNNGIKISIDIPSGMMEGQISNVLIKADYTFAFQFPKLEFFLPDTGDYVGNWKILDIGLHPESYIHEKPIAYFVTEEMVQPFFESRKKFSHKGSFGHACIVGGSFGKIGAVVLAAHACLRTGAGLTTAIIPKCGYEILQTALPEVMTEVSSGENFIEPVSYSKINFSSIGLGPGMGVEPETQDAFKGIIQNATCPLVIDADALNILSMNKTWLSFLPVGSILTPHIGEFKRLVGEWNNSFEMLEKQKDFAFRFQCYLVLKGPYTSVATPSGNIYFNSTGNPGLAKGGSGDTLTGIITALLAQGFSSLEASISGVFLHGLAADLAVKDLNEYSLMPSDVIENISKAISKIQG